MPTDREIAAQALVKMSDEAEMGQSAAPAKECWPGGSSVRVSSCQLPVAVIRDEDPLMPDPLFFPVLVGIDGSPASELATEIAFDEASRRGVDLIVLHAWSDMPILELPVLEFSALLSEEERSLRISGGRRERYPLRCTS